MARSYVLNDATEQHVTPEKGGRTSAAHRKRRVFRNIHQMPQISTKVIVFAIFQTEHASVMRARVPQDTPETIITPGTQANFQLLYG